MPKTEVKFKELLNKANTLPLCPGVYIMKNEDNRVIYVGKAKALYNRLAQYFIGKPNNLKCY